MEKAKQNIREATSKPPSKNSKLDQNKEPELDDEPCCSKKGKKTKTNKRTVIRAPGKRVVRRPARFLSNVDLSSDSDFQ